MFTRIKQNQKFAAKMWKSKFAQTPAINSPYWTIHRYVTANVCNSQLVNKVGCFRVFVVFFLWMSQIGKRIPNPYTRQEYPFFSPCHGNFLSLYFSSMGIKCPNIFPDVDFSHPKNSPRWDFSVPNIIWYGVLMSQKFSSCGVWLSRQFH